MAPTQTSGKTSTAPSPSSEKWDVARLVKEFGPFKNIDRDRASQLRKEGRFNYMFNLISYEQEYADIPDEEKPDDEELEMLEQTKEEFSRGCFEGCVGFHIVNVSERYESTKPMPDDLMIADDDIWFGDDGLPNP